MRIDDSHLDGEASPFIHYFLYTILSDKKK